MHVVRSGAGHLKHWYFSNDYDPTTLLDTTFVTLLIVDINNNAAQLLKRSKI